MNEKGAQWEDKVLEEDGRKRGVYSLTPSTDSTGMDALLDRDDEYVLCWTDPTRSICVGTLSSA